jgi:hypothetical protein
LQFLYKEGSLLCIQVDELSLSVLFSDFPEVHVDDLASFEVLVIKVTHNELALGNVGQKLLFCDLSVLSMALNEVFLLLLVVVFHFCHSPLADVAHDFLFFITKTIIVFVTRLFVMMIVQQTALVFHIMILAFLIFKLLLNLNGLVFDGLFHDHLRKDVGSHFLHSLWGLHDELFKFEFNIIL